MTRIDAYRNLHDQCISVKCMDTDRADYGRVIEHTQQIFVSNPTFVVNQRGREKAVETGVKNAHAFVRGQWDDSLNVIDAEPITYNPFAFKRFVHAETERPVKSAEKAMVSSSGVSAVGLSYAD
jgi:hypothetical protein